MKRREFIALSLALGSSAFAPRLFAKDNLTLYGAPALPSVMIATAFLQGKINNFVNPVLKIWKSPDQLRAGVASGEFKVMMSPANVGVNLRNQGQNVAMFNNLTNGILSILSKKQNVTNLIDLEGKKIILAFKNDMPDIVFKILCKKSGIDMRKIDITYAATPPETVSQFLMKDYDIAFIPEPMASVCLLKGKKMGLDIKRGFNFVNEWAKLFNSKPFLPQAGIIVNLDFYEKNLEIFDTFQSDLENALKWMLENKQQAAKIGTNYLPAPEIALANSFDYANLCAIRARDIKDEAMKFFEIMAEFNPKLIGGKLPEQSYFL